jgi:hypothetical protein
VTYGLAGSLQRIGRVVLVRKDGVWQSRSLTDRTGAVWWGVLWFGSRGWVCLGAMRSGTLRFGSRGLDGMGAETVNRGGVWYGSHGSSGEVRFGSDAVWNDEARKEPI